MIVVRCDICKVKTNLDCQIGTLTRTWESDLGEHRITSQTFSTEIVVTDHIGKSDAGRKEVLHVCSDCLNRKAPARTWWSWSSSTVGQKSMRKVDQHEIPDAEVLRLVAAGGNAYGELCQLYPARAVMSKILDMERRGLVATGVSIRRSWLTRRGKEAAKSLPVREASGPGDPGAEPSGARIPRSG